MTRDTDTLSEGPRQRAVGPGWDGPSEPNLLRHLFPSHRLPRLGFSEGAIAAQVPPAVFCVDSTFGQGLPGLQRATVEQVEQVVDRLDQLKARGGLLQRIELGVEVGWCRDLVMALLERHHEDRRRLEPVATVHPSPAALEPLVGLGLREAGLALGVSDYALHLARVGSIGEVIGTLLRAIETCLEQRIQPRLDLLDVTRVDLEGVLLPLLERCQDQVTRLGGGQLRVRLCDTLGLGLPWAEVPVPRSVPRMVRAVADTLGLQPPGIEFTGSNDLGLALANAVAAAVNGCGWLVGSLGGVGERSGIAPLELLLVQIGGLYGVDCDLHLLGEVIAAMEPLGLELAPRHPLWGGEAQTASQVQSLGPLEETAALYAPFDTEGLLGRGPTLRIRPSTGAVGIAWLIRRHLPGSTAQPDDDEVQRIFAAVAEGGEREITWDTIEPLARELLKP